ncbi:MAG: ATP synthase F0 subunit B [Myxococcota bacterium]
MEIYPDPVHTALLTLPFLVALVSMYLILWNPLLAYLDARDEASERARHEAKELDSAADEQLSRIEGRLAEARVQVHELRQTARSGALAREAEIVAAARAQADDHVRAAVAQIATDRREASVALQTSAQELSREIAEQVLGRTVQG